MLQKLSRILGIIGSVLSLCEVILFTLVFMFAAFAPPPGGFSELEGFLINNGFAICVFLMLLLVCGLIGSLNVRKSPLKSGAAMIISGALTFVFLYLLVADNFWPGWLPPLPLIAAGVLAIISRLTGKKALGAGGSLDPNSK